MRSTDFQTLAISGSLNQTRGWSNYLVFDFDGPIDLRRFEQACTQLLPKRPQFNFVRMQLYSNDGAEQFFSRMLAGSEMTSIINPASKKSANVMNTMIMEMIPFVAFRNHGITAVTVAKAALALVLAELAATSDVVYGHMVLGRNLPLDGVESVMGLCLNIVPVRANMNNMNTILDLLQTTQQQQTDTIPHESMGFRQIIDKCTDWPSGTRLNSVFQYQEFGGGEELAPGRSVPVEGVLKCAPGFICPAPDAYDLSILATAVNSQNVVRVEMIFR